MNKMKRALLNWETFLLGILILEFVLNIRSQKFQIPDAEGFACQCQ